jgi:hypothetical protein
MSSRVNGTPEPPTRRELGEALQACTMMLSRMDMLLMMLLRAKAGGPECRCGHLAVMHLDGEHSRSTGKCMAFNESLGKYEQCKCMATDVNLIKPASSIITGRA